MSANITADKVIPTQLAGHEQNIAATMGNSSLAPVLQGTNVIQALFLTQIH